jgi:imidazole glycerol-phosphate synthase subunit HisF
LDIKDGKTVKGVNFENLRDAGSPTELAQFYAQQGADELVFLDITATVEKRKTLIDLVREVARHLNIPFTVGGGISSIQDVSALLNAGADKISINSSAVKNPNLIDELANEFGSQCVVLAIDTRQIAGNHIVHTHGGRTPTSLHTQAWANEAVERGAGEILLTSMDADGTKVGFDCNITALVSGNVNVPVIASGGAGTMQHFEDVFTIGKADAGLAASIFHFKEVQIPDLKRFLESKHIAMRPFF